MHILCQACYPFLLKLIANLSISLFWCFMPIESQPAAALGGLQAPSPSLSNREEAGSEVS